MTFPKPQKLYRYSPCLLEHTYLISLKSVEAFLSYRVELDFDVNCSSCHTVWPFELLKKVFTSHWTFLSHIQKSLTYLNGKGFKSALQTTDDGRQTTDGSHQMLSSHSHECECLLKMCTVFTRILEHVPKLEKVHFSEFLKIFFFSF